MVYALIVLAVLLVAVFLAVLYIKKFRKLSGDYDDLLNSHIETSAQLEYLKPKMLWYVVLQALAQMDKTCAVWVDEDEASRELTTCLNLLGHDAKYHYSLGGRTADIFLEGTIIEAKLDPTQGDVDRLFGQVAGYLESQYHILIVIYGRADKLIVDRIKSQILDKNPNRIELIFLDNANRIRKQF
jgi:hypothetical protein